MNFSIVAYALKLFGAIIIKTLRNRLTPGVWNQMEPPVTVEAQAVASGVECGALRLGRLCLSGIDRAAAAVCVDHSELHAAEDLDHRDWPSSGPTARGCQCLWPCIGKVLDSASNPNHRHSRDAAN